MEYMTDPNLHEFFDQGQWSKGGRGGGGGGGGQSSLPPNGHIREGALPFQR